MKCPSCSRETTIPGEKCALCLLLTHPDFARERTLTEEFLYIARPVDARELPNPYDLEVEL
jgi:hypothetical protein